MFKKIFIATTFMFAAFSCGHRDPHKDNYGYQKPPQANGGYHQESAQVDNDADNTALNQRDTDQKTLTPPDQARGSSADVQITRNIRRAINDDDSLSMDAQNVKIITLKGKTTLRGPVETMDEKFKIEKLARRAGAKSISNELEVTRKTE